jgi:putative addiction module component (TIGR02574 family)
MGKAAKRVLQDALELPTKERAELAADLIASLDGPADPDVEAAWAAEIERRASRVLAGKSRGIPWEVVRRRAERDLTKR